MKDVGDLSVILVFLFVVILSKLIVCALTISHCNHVFTIMIHLTLVLAHISTEASYLLSLLSIIHYSPINFTPKHIIQLYSALSPISHTFHHIVPPEDIIWLSFDSITTSLGVLFSLCSREAITNFVFETNL